MSQDHIKCDLNGFSGELIQYTHQWNKVRSSVAWEQAQGLRRFNRSICGWRYFRVISNQPLGYGLFIVLPLVPEIKKCFRLRGLPVGELFSSIILFPPPFFFQRFLQDSLHFCLSQSSTVEIHSHVCVAAIHQRLESDGTERVEGSMTQRLENILNSKHLFFIKLIHSPQGHIADCVYSLCSSCY